MSQKLRFPLLLVLIAVLLPSAACRRGSEPPPAAEPSASLPLDRSLEEVLAGYYRGLGDLERLRGLESLCLRGQMSSTSAPAGEITLCKQSPDRLRRELRRAGWDQPMLEIVAGAQGWRLDPAAAGASEAQAMNAKERERFLRAAEIEGPLVGHQEKGHELVLENKSLWSDREVYRLRMTRADGLEVLFYLDAESFLLVGTRSLPYVGAAGDLEVETSYSDHRLVGGISWPHLERTRMVRQPFEQTFTWKEVELDPELGPDVFAEP